MAASIEILYLRYPVHPNITVIQIGPGIQRIDKQGESYFVFGTEDGPLAGKKVEIPGDNVAAIQWTVESVGKANASGTANITTASNVARGAATALVQLTTTFGPHGEDQGWVVQRGG